MIDHSQSCHHWITDFIAQIKQSRLHRESIDRHTRRLAVTHLLSKQVYVLLRDQTDHATTVTHTTLDEWDCRTKSAAQSPSPFPTTSLISSPSTHSTTSFALNLTWLSLRVESVSSRGPYSAVIYTVCLGQDQKSELIAALGRPAASTVLAVLVNASQVAAHWLLSGAPDQWRSKGLTTPGPFAARRGRVGRHCTARFGVQIWIIHHRSTLRVNLIVIVKANPTLKTRHTEAHCVSFVTPNPPTSLCQRAWRGRTCQKLFIKSVSGD